MQKKTKTFAVGVLNIQRWLSEKTYSELGEVVPISSDMTCSQFQQLCLESTRNYQVFSFGLTDAGMLLLAKASQTKNAHFSKAIATLQHKVLFYKILESEKIPVLPWMLLHAYQSKKSLTFPLFAKPVRGAFSEGSKQIHTVEDLRSLTPPLVSRKQETQNILFFQEFSPISLDSYILQLYISAPQYTADFFVEDGIVYMTAITASIFDTQGTSFLGFELPVSLSEAYTKKLSEYLQRIVTHLGITCAFFNAEFFIYHNEVYIFECNSRVSAQFLALFTYAFNTNYFEKMIELAQGKSIAGSFQKKLKPAHIFVFRKYSDLLVQNIPTKKNIVMLLNKYHLIELHITAKKQKYLSETKQDSHSFRYAYATIPGTFQKNAALHKQLTNELELLLF